MKNTNGAEKVFIWQNGTMNKPNWTFLGGLTAIGEQFEL